ncbi:cytochrome c family protein [Neorickettsia helminthoeca str. Oregon]|uniref:Cytochrome c homolog n=1 Tax=Neorickettsia helminthoeca str. Oregon TaxID=1286528 RepID=X5GWF7_9RICK|nr:cytochrome c family protein [Neorickettsia helminthoeca]AHX11392.1 cytochrome c family protein [Neorickettsia helminthoeca str. Oregon]
MKNLESNKLFASVLLVGITILSVSNIVDFLYHPKEVAQYGYVANVEQHSASSTGSIASFDPATADLADLFKNANLEAGQKISKKCIACHTFENGGHNKVGPNLWGILGKNKAHLGDRFKYSKGLLEKGGTWDYRSMVQFLYKPSAYIKGTKMAFAGLSKPEEIANLVVYLRSLSDSPEALPGNTQ